MSIVQKTEESKSCIICSRTSAKTKGYENLKKTAKYDIMRQVKNYVTAGEGTEDASVRKKRWTMFLTDAQTAGNKSEVSFRLKSMFEDESLKKCLCEIICSQKNRRSDSASYDAEMFIYLSQNGRFGRRQI